MNKALLPIMARLHSLQIVSRVAPEGGRIIAAVADPAPITAVLREINETVLGRVLHFSTESGSSLSIEVGGRRLLRVVAAEGLANAETCIAAPVLEDEHKDNLINILQELTQPGQEIRLKTEPNTAGSDTVSVGLPVALIADLMLVELNGLDAETPVEAELPPASVTPEIVFEPQTEGSPIGRFARANGSVLMAWLISGGEEDGVVEGPEEMVDHLRGFLEDEIGDVQAQLNRFSRTPDEPVCIALGANLTEGHSIICARNGGSVLLGLAEGDCTQVLLKAWVSALT